MDSRGADRPPDGWTAQQDRSFVLGGGEPPSLRCKRAALASARAKDTKGGRRGYARLEGTLHCSAQGCRALGLWGRPRPRPALLCWMTESRLWTRVAYVQSGGPFVRVRRRPYPISARSCTQKSATRRLLSTRADAALVCTTFDRCLK